MKHVRILKSELSVQALQHPEAFFSSSFVMQTRGCAPSQGGECVLVMNFVQYIGGVENSSCLSVRKESSIKPERIATARAATYDFRRRARLGRSKTQPKRKETSAS